MNRTLCAATGAFALALTLACGFGSRGGSTPPQPETAGRATTLQPPATTRRPPAATTIGPPTIEVPSQPAKLGGCRTVPNGSPCHVTGFNFGYGEQVTLTVQGEGRPRKVVRADQRGNFTWDYALRSAPGDVVTITAEGDISRRTAQFSYTLT